MFKNQRTGAPVAELVGFLILCGYLVVSTAMWRTYTSGGAQKPTAHQQCTVVCRDASVPPQKG